MIDQRLHVTGHGEGSNCQVVIHVSDEWPDEALPTTLSNMRSNEQRWILTQNLQEFMQILGNYCLDSPKGDAPKICPEEKASVVAFST
jgi:hypothetical protein